MTFAIRSIISEDKEQWKKLYVEYLDFYNSKKTDEFIENLWNKFSCNPAQINSLVAIGSGKILGIAHFHFQISTWEVDSVCYLEDLYVLPQARGTGVGRSLIAEVEKVALSKSCSEMYWITRESNQIARDLYERIAKRTDFIRYEIKLTGA